MRPSDLDYNPFYKTYISKIKADSLTEAIALYAQPLKSFYNNLPEAKANYAYADGKWTVKEVLQHVMDTERIMSYRALAIARGESIALPGFDENLYAQNSKAAFRNLTDMQIEFTAIRHATNLLFQSFDEEQLNARGNANNSPITVNALGFIILGHLAHHKQVLEERYL